MERLLPLAAAAARDPRVSGDKAATLARARAAGLPVLPGWVVPVAAGEAALRTGAEAVRRSGPAAACLAVSATRIEEGLARDLERAGRELAGPAVVRSSRLGESDPRWAGALASYLRVDPGDVPAAVRGCWASAFSRDALARADAIGDRPEDVALGVLVQPWIGFEAGGTAAPLPRGGVRVTVAAGGPAALVGGRTTGSVVDVGPDGAAASTDVDPALAARVAELARRVADAVGEPVIEWGARGGEVLVLQARPVPVPTDVRMAPARPRRAMPPESGRIARLAARFPGPLGEALVLPWALGPCASGLGVPGTDAEPASVADPRAAFDAAARLARELTTSAWGDRWGASPARTIRTLLGGDVETALVALARARPIDPAAAARVVSLIRGIGTTLARDGRLPSPEHVWRLTPRELDRAIDAGEAPPVRLGPDRWEPFVFDAVRALGTARRGTPASPGIGAGPAAWVDASSEPPGPRRVLVVREPVPQVAPFLWNAAGLVTSSGSIGAHLFEVARSLGVPAVAGVDLPRTGAPALAAVDGDTAEVALVSAADGRTAATERMTG